MNPSIGAWTAFDLRKLIAGRVRYRIAPRQSRDSLDVSMVIVENEEEWLVFGQVGYEVADPLFELRSRNFHARPKGIMLSRSVWASDTNPP